jgi:formaldehyde-activating enzyme involved in methanogenesis
MHTFNFSGTVYAVLSLNNGRTVYQANAETTQQAINKVLDDAIATEQMNQRKQSLIGNRFAAIY